MRPFGPAKGRKKRRPHRLCTLGAVAGAVDDAAHDVDGTPERREARIEQPSHQLRGSETRSAYRNAAPRRGTPTAPAPGSCSAHAGSC